MGQIHDSHILLVDDNEQLRHMVTGILQKEGFLHLSAAADCRSCREICREGMPDLIILDIGLPDGDGFTLLHEIRVQSNVPVLFLSARDEDNDRLLGLGLGADDYLTKPFLPKELVLRIIAILKRTYFPAGAGIGRCGETLVLGSRTVDFGEGVVRSAGGGCCRLTAKEMILLRKLWENRGRIVTFDTLSQALWGDFYYGYENSLMVHIRRLREKIEEMPSQPQYLTTARGLGYKLEKTE